MAARTVTEATVFVPELWTLMPLRSALLRAAGMA
jgi:hypothetical protein